LKKRFSLEKLRQPGLQTNGIPEKPSAVHGQHTANNKVVIQRPAHF
jgi:hypothetical protein